LHGVAPEVRLPPNAYSDAANAAVNAELVYQTRLVAAGGHSVILDATFLDPSLRLSAAQNAPSRFLGIWLHVPLPELEQRVASRRDDASDATLDVLRRVAAADKGPMDWVEVVAADTDAAVRAIRQAIAKGIGRAG
jgi:uncharacterized protein